MKKISYWINFLHFYLPPTAEINQISEATQKSYEWILLMAEKYPNWRFTFNLTGCLTQALFEKGYEKIITRFKNLLNRGQIELVDSLSHHPIAPLVDQTVVERQIKKQQEINKNFFNQKPKGFFLPEMAYSEKIGKILANYGYQWLILDEISLNGKLDKVDYNIAYFLKNTNLKIIFRSRRWSLDYPPRQLAKESTENLPNFIISATDAELYGLRFVDFQGWLGKVLENPKIKTITIDEYLKKLTKTKYIKPKTGNWESLEKELNKKFSFVLWQNKNNKIHNLLWQLANIATEQLKQNPNDINYHWAEKHLDRGLASCTFWWASNRDFKLFGAPAWHPEEVEKGALELIKTIRTLAINKDIKLKAEKIYHQLKYLLWSTHWKKYGQ